MDFSNNGDNCRKNEENETYRNSESYIVNEDDNAVELLDPIIISPPNHRMAYSNSLVAGPSFFNSINQSTLATQFNKAMESTTPLFPSLCNSVVQNPWTSVAHAIPSTTFFGLKMEPMKLLDGIPASNPTSLMGKTSTKPVDSVNNELMDQHNTYQGEDSGIGLDKTGMTASDEAMTTNAVHNCSVSVTVLPSPLQSFHPINSFETYCTVPGRLTLLCSQKKYRVSIGEVQRRLAPPECLNASILGGILRKAKNRNGGRLLREQLHTYGVELVAGRRRQSALTCFTSLVEEEAAQMAFDFRMICQRGYPVQAAAAHLFAGISNVQDIALGRLELFYASKFLSRILGLQKADKSKTLADQPKVEADYGHFVELNPQLQEGLTNFSLMTHGFGGHATQTVLETLMRVIDECTDALEPKYQPPNGH